MFSKGDYVRDDYGNKAQVIDVNGDGTKVRLLWFDPLVAAQGQGEENWSPVSVLFSD